MKTRKTLFTRFLFCIGAVVFLFISMNLSTVSAEQMQGAYAEYLPSSSISAKIRSTLSGWLSEEKSAELLDGDITTGWSSAGNNQDSNSYAILTLDKAYDLTGLKFYGHPQNGRKVKDYALAVSRDGEEYEQIQTGTITHGSSGVQRVEFISVTDHSKALGVTHIKLTFVSGHYDGVGCMELKVKVKKQDESVMLSEDFNNLKADDWNTVAGTALYYDKINGGEAGLTASLSRVLLKNYSFSNFILDIGAAHRSESPSNSQGIWFRSSVVDTNFIGYFLLIDNINDKISLRRYPGNTLLGEAAVTINLGEFVDIRLVAEDNTFTVYLQGEDTPLFTAQDNTYESGAIGFGTSWVKIGFRDLIIRDLPHPPIEWQTDGISLVDAQGESVETVAEAAKLVSVSISPTIDNPYSAKMIIAQLSGGKIASVKLYDINKETPSLFEADLNLLAEADEIKVCIWKDLTSATPKANTFRR